MSLVAQVGNQRQRLGVSPLRWRDIKLPTGLQKKNYIHSADGTPEICSSTSYNDALQYMANYNDCVSDEGLREGRLVNWLITERETGHRAAASSWLQNYIVGSF